MSIQDQLETGRTRLAAAAYDQALDLFEQIIQTQPDALTLQHAEAGRIRALTQLGQLDTAHSHLTQCLQSWPTSVLIMLAGVAWAKVAGKTSLEETLARQAFAARPDALWIATGLFQILIQTRQFDDLQQAYDRFVAETGDDLSLRWALARICEAKQGYDAGYDIWRGIYGHPDCAANARITAVKGMARCCVQAGDYEKLRALFDSFAVIGPDRPAALAMLPTQMDTSNAALFPLELLRDTADANPGDGHAYDALKQRLSQSFNASDLNEIPLRRLQRRGLVRDDLRGQIAALSVPPSQSAANRKLVTFWELCGRPYGSLADWLAAAAWQAQADELVMLYTAIKTNNEDHIFDQITDITDPPDYTLVHDALAQGKGCLMAGSHLGPVWAHALLTSRHFDNLGMIGGKPRFWMGQGRQDVWMRTAPLQARRNIQRYLAQNAIMWCGPDSVHKSDPKHLFNSDFGPLPVQTSYAHIQYRTGAPGVWSERYWKDKRIHTAYKKMPSPEPDEGLRDFVTRWCETYLAYITDMLKHRIADTRYAYVIGRDWSY